MDERSAQEVIRMIEGAWGYDYGDKGRKLWREMLVPFDAELATHAVARLSQRQAQRPTIADVRQMIVAMRAELAQKMGPKAMLPPRHTVPEWVYVWWWARRNGNFVPFPQQQGFVDDALAMTMDEYDELAKEWKKAGAPKTDVAAAIRGDAEPLIDYAARVTAVLQEVAE